MNLFVFMSLLFAAKYTQEIMILAFADDFISPNDLNKEIAKDKITKLFQMCAHIFLERGEDKNLKEKLPILNLKEKTTNEIIETIIRKINESGLLSDEIRSEAVNLFTEFEQCYLTLAHSETGCQAASNLNLAYEDLTEKFIEFLLLNKGEDIMFLHKFYSLFYMLRAFYSAKNVYEFTRLQNHSSCEKSSETRKNETEKTKIDIIGSDFFAVQYKFCLYQTESGIEKKIQQVTNELYEHIPLCNHIICVYIYPKNVLSGPNMTKKARKYLYACQQKLNKIFTPSHLLSKLTFYSDKSFICDSVLNQCKTICEQKKSSKSFSAWISDYVNFCQERYSFIKRNKKKRKTAGKNRNFEFHRRQKS